MLPSDPDIEWFTNCCPLLACPPDQSKVLLLEGLTPVPHGLFNPGKWPGGATGRCRPDRGADMRASGRACRAAASPVDLPASEHVIVTQAGRIFG